MKALTALLFSALVGVCCAGVNQDAMLEAIRLKENSCGLVGSRGERGCWQLMPVNVKKYGGHSKAHAESHLRHVIQTLSKRGIDPNPFNIGLAWNAGEYNIGRKSVPMSSYGYARDAAAIYGKILPSYQPVR
jgi:hypothetical protein